MTVDEKYCESLRQGGGNYTAGIIKPDGEYVPAMESHLHTLMSLAGMPEESAWDMIPKDDSALFWMIAYTGCVITDKNASVGLVMTKQQEKTYQALVQYGIILDKYYDITNERKRAAEEHGG